MSQVIQRVADPELFFGIVAPIGTNVEQTVDALKEFLEKFGYTATVIRLTDFFPKLQEHLNLPKKLNDAFLETRYKAYIEFGDALRKRFSDDSFLGAVAVNSIVQKRTHNLDGAERERPQKQAYIVRQFKRREEVDFLRSIYGRLFFQVSIYSKRSSRVDNLARKIASSHNSADPMRYRDEAEKLVRTDENEIDDAHGQRVSDVFHEADFIVSSDLAGVTANEQVARFVNLVFGNNSVSPTKMEYGMYTAKSASLRTLDLSRQVGAATFTAGGDIISIGANEVPRGGGGTYWADDPLDDRDFRRGVDSNEKRKREIMSELVDAISPGASRAELMKRKSVRKSQFMDALEYGRIIHAEMCAITDAARLGRPLRDSVLYCTTFPCHMCAQHIVASGIRQVVFLEPYPKSLANELHGDSIEIEGQSRGDYADFPSCKFTHFFGVSPRRYRDSFERKKRKWDDGKFKEWSSSRGHPEVVVEVKLPVYLVLEKHLIDNLLRPWLRDAGVPLAALRESR